MYNKLNIIFSHVIDLLDNNENKNLNEALDSAYVQIISRLSGLFLRKMRIINKKRNGKQLSVHILDVMDLCLRKTHTNSFPSYWRISVFKFFKVLAESYIPDIIWYNQENHLEYNCFGWGNAERGGLLWQEPSFFYNKDKWNTVSLIPPIDLSFY